MRVFVAMSGGVDSSVAAALLARAGHDVVGITMQLLPEGDRAGECCGDDAIRAARRVCDTLGIPHYTVNMREVFDREVIEPFARAYAAGLTPNPCIACNDRLKFSHLLAWASAQGAEALATGHYAQIVADADGTPWLSRGVDAGKDQSYFLYRLVPPALDRIMFPVGAMTKSAVREEAAALALSTAQRPESQEICFVGDTPVADFVAEKTGTPPRPGDIVDTSGSVIGTHRGVACYTVGQRKGLGIAAPGPLYVVRVNVEENTVVVGTSEQLAITEVRAVDAVWRVTAASARVTVQTRYRMEPVPATANYDGHELSVVFDEPTIGVAPGQAVVCYDGERVIGGGVASAKR